jgi:hypothetical protein
MNRITCAPTKPTLKTSPCVSIDMSPAFIKGVTDNLSNAFRQRPYPASAWPQTIFPNASCPTSSISFLRLFCRYFSARFAMMLVDLPFSGGDYFEVIMRVGRPIWRGARLRRAGEQPPSIVVVLVAFN